MDVEDTHYTREKRQTHDIGDTNAARSVAGYIIPIVAVLGATLLMPPFPILLLILAALALLGLIVLVLVVVIQHIKPRQQNVSYFSSQEPEAVSQSSTVSGIAERASCLVEQRGKV